jgi:hypothetical protein
LYCSSWSPFVTQRIQTNKVNSRNGGYGCRDVFTAPHGSIYQLIHGISPAA